MALAARLTARFNSYYEQRPIITMMVTNAILGGIADTVAQTITSIRERALRQPGGVKKGDGIAIEIHELDRKNPFYERDLIPDNIKLPPPFDFERLTRFMAYGFCMAPVQFKWFKFLERIFPITKTAAFGPAMKRVAFDQFIFAPFGVGVFFTAMTIAEGGGRRAVTNKLRDMYVPTLKANYVVWPAVQIVNFRLMPVQYQLVSLWLTLRRRCLMHADVCSPLSRLSVLHGPHTSHSATLPMLRMESDKLIRCLLNSWTVFAIR